MSRLVGVFCGPLMPKRRKKEGDRVRGGGGVELEKEQERKLG